MSNVKIYKCFIASPSDIIDERKECDKVFSEINKNLGENFNFRVEALKWEDASSSINSEPQAVINEQFFGKYEVKIFIGIMYQHFGKSTKNYGSGTEEEFYTAYDIYLKDHEKIEIKFYFNDAPIKPSDINSEQSRKVGEFKKVISDSGVLYKSYEGVSDFKDKLRSDLYKYFSEIYKSNTIVENIHILEKRLKDSLVGYHGQDVQWIDRVLYKNDDSVKSFDDVDKVDISSLIKKPHSLLIVAPQEFGLTCFAHHLILKASEQGDKWIYLDANKDMRDISKAIEKECESFNFDKEDINCIILDSWNIEMEGSIKIIKNLCKNFANIPIFIMSSQDKNLPNSIEINVERDFKKYSMLPLTKNNIREMVSHCQGVKNDEKTLHKIILDFDTLNIHRTPANCLSLLKILENPNLENPVNRTKMISMLLTVIFDFTEIPHYSRKPELEHCEFILGCYCEKMIDAWDFKFKKDDFIQDSLKLIGKQKLNVDVYAIFDILLKNNIFIAENSQIRFRNAFWVYYFAAKRMKFDNAFLIKMLKNKKYISCVEMIEFYSGITKNENGLIDSLTEDLKKQCDKVESKTGLSSHIDPLKELTWDGSKQEIKDSFQRIKDEVGSSNLSSSLKDSYADNMYNIKEPYNQDIHLIYEKYDFLTLKQQIHVCSRALRNSDLIKAEKKELLLQQIMRGWYLISKLIFVMTPLFAKQGFLNIDGLNFVLYEEYNDMDIDIEQKIKAIIISNPKNIRNFFYDDLYSERLSPIFFDLLNSQENTLIQHFIVLLLIRGKPSDWVKNIEQYLIKIPANSAYLLNIINNLLHTYKYDYSTENQLNEIKESIYLAYTRKMSPNTKYLRDEMNSLKKSDKLKLNVPKRIFDNESM